MKIEKLKVILAESFRKAFGDQDSSSDPPSGNHPATSLEFLERLDNEVLLPEERNNFLRHIETCPFCRREIAALIRNGILYADTDVTREESPEAVISNRLKKRQNYRYIIGVLTAVVLLIVVVGPFVWRLGGPNRQDLARRQLQKTLTTDDQAYSTRLSDYGYLLTGHMAIKDFFMPDDHTEAVRTAYRQALDDVPDAVELRFDFARYLLYVLHEPAEARVELEKLIAKEPNRVEFTLALGIACFNEGDDLKAQEAFRIVLAKIPDSFDAQLNLAISLYRGGQLDEAREIYESLRHRPEAKSLAGQIDALLKKETNK